MRSTDACDPPPSKLIDGCFEPLQTHPSLDVVHGQSPDALLERLYSLSPSCQSFQFLNRAFSSEKEVSKVRALQ
jgi:hypothetical protein